MSTAVIEMKSLSLTGRTFEGRDFGGENLRQADLHNSKFTRCNFDGVDMSFANCEGSNFAGSSFRGAICYCTNFKDARLGATIFEPKDCYGMTVTLKCGTFQNMHVSKLWYYCWLIMATLMVAPEPEMKSLVIGVIGAEKYTRLRNLFARRDV